MVKALVLRENQAPDAQPFVVVASANDRLIANTRPSEHRAIATVLAAMGQASGDRK